MKQKQKSKFIELEWYKIKRSWTHLALNDIFSLSKIVLLKWTIVCSLPTIKFQRRYFTIIFHSPPLSNATPDVIFFWSFAQKERLNRQTFHNFYSFQGWNLSVWSILILTFEVLTVDDTKIFWQLKSGMQVFIN